jgi:hypothetical protein
MTTEVFTNAPHRRNLEAETELVQEWKGAYPYDRLTDL